MSSSDYYFELSANGEQTTFEMVDGVSTEPALKHALQPGDHPFKYRLPSLPKSDRIILKNGKASPGSRIMEWFGRPEEEQEAPEKSRVILYLKDSQGKPLVEWTLHNAYPMSHHTQKLDSKIPTTVIDDLEVGYSFYTFSKR